MVAGGDISQVENDIESGRETTKMYPQVGKNLESSIPGAERTQTGEFLGWLATFPLIVVIVGEILQFNEVSYSGVRTLLLFLSAYGWYAVVITLEAVFRLSALESRLRSASRQKETTDERITKAKDTSCMRLEIHLSCVQADARTDGLSLADNSSGEIMWTETSTFPIGVIKDRTRITEEWQHLPVVCLLYSVRYELSDECSCDDFRRLIEQLKRRRSPPKEGQYYRVSCQLVSPGIPSNGTRVVSYASEEKIRPWYASQAGYWIFTLLGLTVMYRLISKHNTTQVHVRVHKQISSIWPGNDDLCDSQSYPVIDFGMICPPEHR